MANIFTWANDASGSWTSASDWSPAGGPPDSGGVTALIAQTGASYDVSITGTVISIGTLLLESNAGTLVLSDGSLATNNVTLTAGTIAIGASSTLSATTATQIGAVIDINGGYFAAAAIGVTAGGTIDFTGNGGMSYNGALTAAAGSLIEVTSGTATVGGSNTTLADAGTILANGGTLVLAAQAGGAVVTIGDSSASDLEISGPLYYGNTVTADFLGAAGEFGYTGGQGNLTFDAAGLNAAASKTNFLDIAGDVTVTSGETGSGGSGTVVLSNGDTLVLSGITELADPNWGVETQSDGAAGTEIWLQALCFARGTNILTPDGEKPVETLRPGEMVITETEGEPIARPVRWIGTRRIDLAAHRDPKTAAPVRIRQGAIAEGVPHRDLLVSPDHAILLLGKLICARQLVNGATIRQETGCQAVDYFHVELDRHAILLAEGLTAESYLDTGNRNFFANAGKPMLLHPNLLSEADCVTREAHSCAPFAWDEATVQPIWRMLADHAVAQGFMMGPGPGTTDPDLDVLADGQRLRRLPAPPGWYYCVVPAGVPAVTILSRAAAPSDARPWLEDRRRLGVYMEQILLRAGPKLRDLPLDHPSLTAGWWDAEGDGAEMRRWTDGAALLPLPNPSGPVILELRFGTGTLSYPVGEPDVARAA